MRKTVSTVLAGAALIVAASTIISPAGAQTAQQWKCTGNPDIAWDQQIAGCTDTIQSGKYSGAGLAWAYGNRGRSYRVKKDYDRAIADFSEAIRLDPKIAKAYNERGGAYYGKKDYDRAIADYSEAIRLNPKYAHAYSGRCWDRAIIGADLQGALADCNESLRLQPNDSNTLNSRGLVQFKLKSFDLAIADYSAAIALNAKDADSLYGRGIARLKKGDAAGGNADIAAAKALKPDVAEVSAGYGLK